ncbi:hypothetical protein [Pseudoduganella lutea]|uniref:Uncharacterized protein n=1 Tax=Pseudoduganella lutea TaxID=321985 RepID=A0A4V0Z3T5_9BURK|nr:hypothetical protein [Pseudoduganella lutea]QBE64563.1 hypothetical protein EWM63_17495 [Pseudoduganella lutea]
MPTQSYRGHVIDVACQSLGERITYLISITVGATGELRHRDDSLATCFNSDSEALDRAFTDARSWIERSPLRWPFPVRAGTAQ